MAFKNVNNTKVLLTQDEEAAIALRDQAESARQDRINTYLNLEKAKSTAFPQVLAILCDAVANSNVFVMDQAQKDQLANYAALVAQQNIKPPELGQ